MKFSGDITDLIQKAENLKNQEKYEEALEILEILFKNTESKHIKKLLIETLFDYGGYLNDYYILEYEKATKIFDKIIKLSPNNYRAHYNLGIAYFNLGQIENAKKSFNSALKIKPDYKYCLYNLGLIYEDSKNYEEALKYYDQAIEIDPNFTYALAARSQIRQILDNLK
jgi:tetratricopeptide (TPR) repeat protein